jgi:hypothetical protein
MTFLLPLICFARTALQWLARLPWYYITIAALCAACVILWAWGSHNSTVASDRLTKLKAERVAHKITRKSVGDLMLAVKKQNDAIEWLAVEGKKRVQTGREALQAREPARLVQQARIDRLARPDALTGRCVTSIDVMESGL